MSDASSPRGNEDSGLINLDALMKGAAESEPAPPVVVPPPTAVLSPPPPPVRPRSVPPALPVVAPPPRRVDDSLEGVASAAAPVVPPAAPAVLAPAPAPEWKPRQKRRLVPILLGLAALAGIAAIALHPWQRQATATTPTAVAVAVKPTAPAVAAKAPSDPSGMDPNALPAADVAPSASAAVPASTTTAPVAATPQASPKPEATTKLTEKDLGTMPTGDQGDLAGAMKSAVGPKDAPTETTKGPNNTGANQIRPAAGQVVGAIGAVLPAARACLGPDDSIRSGSLVFSNDGSVKQVSLSGGAKPTDDCIKSALSKAKLQPFAEDSFTTRVTVRP